MAVTARGLIGTGSATTAGTTITVTNTTGATIPAGTFIHITGCWDNINSVTAPTITSSTVGGGTATANHATAIGSGVTTTAGSGVWHQCFRVLTTGTIASGGTIATLTSNQSAVKRAAHAEGFNNCTTTLRGTVTTGTSGAGTPTVTTTGTALVVGDLVIGSISNENNAQATADADTTGGAWPPIVGIATSGGAANTNVNSGTQYKILTATGTQTFNPTCPATDAVVCVYSLVPVPDPTFTQAAYRLYADGTESGSTALAGQDTAPEVDVSGGDVNLQLRVRLQSTNAGTQAATDDYQLQWDKNSSGTWTALQTSVTNLVPNPSFEVGVPDWEAATAGGSSVARDSTKGGAVAASGSWAMKSTTITLSNNSFRLGPFAPTLAVLVPVQSSTTYTMSCYVWLPTGHADVTFEARQFNAAATSVGATASVSTVFVRDSWRRLEVTFTTGSTVVALSPQVNSPAEAAGQSYWVDAFMLIAGSVNRAYFDGTTAGASWSGTAHNSASTLIIAATTTVVLYDSANLTDGAATTNRLGAGTGSFSAGEVSEDGTVDDLVWTANNYTELLYSITLKQADLVDGDTLTFRVVRNGLTTGLTYTQTPTIDIGGGVPTVTGTALISLAVTATVDGVPTTYGTAVTSTAVDVTVTAIRETFGTALIEITGNTSATVGAVITTGTALITTAVTIDVAGTVVAEIVTGTALVTASVETTVTGTPTTFGTALLTQSVDVTVAGTVVAEVVSGTALISSGVAVTAAGTVIAEVVTGTALLTQSVAVTVAGTVVAEIVTGTAAFTSSVAVTVAGTVVAEVVTGTALLSSSVTTSATGTSFSPGGGTALISVPVAITAQGTVVAEVVTGTALLSAAVSVTTAGARTGTGTAALTASVAVTAIGTRAAVTAGTALLASAVVIDATGTVIAEVVSGTASITASVSIVVSVLKVYERAPYTATWSLLYMGTLEVDARATANFDYADGWDTNATSTVDHDYAHSWELV